MKIEAVVFDFDDTLTNWHGAVSGALEEIGPAAGLSRRQMAQVREVMRQFVCVERDGRVVDRQHWRLVESHEPWQHVIADAERRNRIMTAFREALLPRLGMYEDFEVLTERRLAYRVAMLTNNPYAKTALELRGQLHLFEHVVMPEEPDAKPHAAAFSATASVLGLEPAEIVYVGDSIANDVEGAMRAGWTPIWIDRFGDGYEIPGVERISTLHELPAVLQRLQAPG